ncbi:MAG TPA: hypothetical protein DET40_15715 [Lentisphaeria bacterium]|nr:MAG: hypothetical protein A2X45_14240 [Lentisphaerae bacterium GWF2_50_93]HCE44987.1 hypothetical protein [Lentisphaeria bacterium]
MKAMIILKLKFTCLWQRLRRPGLVLQQMDFIRWFSNFSLSCINTDVAFAVSAKIPLLIPLARDGQLYIKNTQPAYIKVPHEKQ